MKKIYEYMNDIHNLRTLKNMFSLINPYFTYFALVRSELF